MTPYVPDLGIKYPENPNEHMDEIKITHERVLDENYPFLDKSFKFNFIRNMMHLTIFALVFTLCSLRFGLKVEGRGNLRKHRKLLKNGAMTASNHIHRWDLLFVLKAVRYRTVYFPALKEHIRSPDEGFVRLSGGIPIPTDVHLMKHFFLALDEIHARKKWIHVYPESSLFDYFQPIRPFKKGVFTLAYRYRLPVLPLAFSYRKPHFPFTLVNLLRRFTGNKELPMITLRIGEPILADGKLSPRDAVQKLRKECHEAMLRLAGITYNQYTAEGD